MPFRLNQVVNSCLEIQQRQYMFCFYRQIPEEPQMESIPIPEPEQQQHKEPEESISKEKEVVEIELEVNVFYNL